MSNLKYFADETSFFCIVTDCKFSEFNLHNGLNKINNWEFHWTMSFNLDSYKQAQEVIFSSKIHEAAYPPLLFNNCTMNRTDTQNT